MAITKKTVEEAPTTEEVTIDAAGEVVEENTVSATDKLLVLNTSEKKICLQSGILGTGDEGIATRAELGTLWQFLELAEKQFHVQ